MGGSSGPCVYVTSRVAGGRGELRCSLPRRVRLAMHAQSTHTWLWLRLRTFSALSTAVAAAAAFAAKSAAPGLSDACARRLRCSERFASCTLSIVPSRRRIASPSSCSLSRSELRRVGGLER